MDFREIVFHGIMWALMMVSWKVARQGRVLTSICLGALAWCSLFLPRMLIWPNPEQKNTEWWWLLIGAVVFIGGPLLVLAESKRKKNSDSNAK
ncbi:hypothetical protein RY831_26050 [Noviherbaspirillum sp. CPCC 100848]|uniref:Transmembrane protein n=1 Tax=Noviherbaspirillum album TaxID=3080276 RepID=A0ABU6JG43_9BURK|nr:hypothetical protein [Noviherbaspirillum sp. CPCC 100848]MEC4722634.1 hypothetical protein [Noviherbaspirillum sp. CPCC 100848]